MIFPNDWTFEDEPGLGAITKLAVWYRAVETLGNNGMRLDPIKHSVAEDIRELEERE